jgi:hypothetical protein
MMMARPKSPLEKGTTAFIIAPSRKCKWQSSGRLIIISVVLIYLSI